MKIRGLLLATTMLIAPGAFADGDSSSDAGAAFQAVSSSEGMIVMVPINAAGDELVAEAETRLVTEAVNSATDFATSFEAATTVNTDIAVTDFDVNGDSATSGWYYGGDSYRSYQHCRTSNQYYPNYYHNYTPSYYHHGNQYNYYRPVHQTYYGHHYPQHHGNHYGYRYYHYQRSWH